MVTRPEPRRHGWYPSSRGRANASAPLPASARKSHAELRPDVVELARRLRRKRPKGGQRSLRDVAADLAQRGHLNEQGRPFSAVRAGRHSYTPKARTSSGRLPTRVVRQMWPVRGVYER